MSKHCQSKEGHADGRKPGRDEGPRCLAAISSAAARICNTAGGEKALGKWRHGDRPDFEGFKPDAIKHGNERRRPTQEGSSHQGSKKGVDPASGAKIACGGEK